MRRLALAAVVIVGVVYGGTSLLSSQDAQAVLLQEASSSSVGQIVIDPTAVKQKIPPLFFGINYSAFWDPAQGSTASARALAQTPIRTVRFPGGIPADWYDWQDPFYKNRSTTSPMQLWRWTRTIGGRHLIFGTNYQGHLPDPPGQAYSVNSPQNAAAWVKYNAKAGINADMEVGNEEDVTRMHSKDDPAFAPYINAFNAQARAMHGANPRVRVLGPVGTNEWYWWALDGLGMFLRGAGNRSGTGQVDGVSLHFYKGSTWADAKGVAQYWLSHDGPWAAIQKMIRANDTRRLPVYITEWNLGGSTSHNAFVPTVGHALAVADMLGAFARSGVEGEDYFVLHSGESWGLLYGEGESRPIDSPTPTYYAMALWRHMSSRMVSVQQSADAATVMSTYATTGRNGSVQVLAINKRPVPQTVRIALQRATPRGHHLRVYALQGTGGSVDDRTARYDGVTMPSPQHPLPGARNLGTVHGNTVTYTVAPYSVVVLALDGTSRAAGLWWKAPQTGAPAPAPHLSISGKVGHDTVRPGQQEKLSATVRSNDDVGPALVDLEVYDSAGAKVFQWASTVNLRANRTFHVTHLYTLPGGAHSGTYHYKVGIFGPTWSPLYVWKDDAGSFTVTS